MGAFFAYTLYSGVFLLLLYLLYKLFLAREKQIALNRTILLGCYAVSFLAWPMMHIEWNPTAKLPVDFTAAMEIRTIAINPSAAITENKPILPSIILWVYLAGVAAVVMKSLFSAVRLYLYIRKGKFIRQEGYKLIVMPGSETAPFSFGHYVVMSEADYATVRDAVAAHEQAHIRCRHYFDLLLAQTVCIVLWYNPASWLMRGELKLLHEYQADAQVLERGVDEKAYQMLLIRKTVGSRFHTFTNNLNHSKLKNRIAMMQKEKSSGWRRCRIALLAIAPVAAIGIVNVPAVASGLDSLGDASLVLMKETKALDGDDASVKVAEFPGGYEKMCEYLAMNFRYPQSAQDEVRQGRSIVGFTVAKDGSIAGIKILQSAGSDLDEEVIRVVKRMPKWIPAMSSGSPVATEFAMPVLYRIKGVDFNDEGINLNVAPKGVNWLDESVVVSFCQL